jgi:hypothetical protein
MRVFRASSKHRNSAVVPLGKCFDERYAQRPGLILIHNKGLLLPCVRYWTTARYFQEPCTRHPVLCLARSKSAPNAAVVALTAAIHKRPRLSKVQN